MKALIFFGILLTVVFVLGALSVAEAHPHATIDLLESHSHDIHDSNFQENFIVHSFEHVIISTFNFIKNLISIPIVSGYAIESPKDQFSAGIDPHDVQCKADYELVFKTTTFEPACIKSTSVEKLMQRGWASDHDPSHMDMMK